MKPSVHLGWAGLLTCAALLLSSITDYPTPTLRNQPVTFAAPVACSSYTGDDMVAFVPVEPMHSEHYYHTATLLEDGTVLVVAGFGFRVPTSATEVYVPTSRSFNILAGDGRERFEHTATLLPDSTVLIVGGQTRADNGGPFGPYVPTTSVIRYSTVTDTFTATGSLLTARAGHTATLLPNGQVLIAGGNSGIAAAELYNPSTGIFMATGNLVTARMEQTATLLPNGQVLIAGGMIEKGWNIYTPTASAELYNPSTGTFTATGNLVTARAGHTATLLPNGQVLIAGGNVAWSDIYTPTASTELYNPSTGTFTATGNLSVARVGHTATLLPQGCVLVISGSSAEIYDATRGKFKLAGKLPPYVNIQGHTATLLPDGTVLIAGGVTYRFGQKSAWLVVRAYQTHLPAIMK